MGVSFPWRIPDIFPGKLTDVPIFINILWLSYLHYWVNGVSDRGKAEEELSRVMDLHKELSSSSVTVPPSPYCLSASQLLGVYGVSETNKSFTPDTFLHLCPAIIYELDQHTCSQPDNHLHSDSASMASQYLSFYLKHNILLKSKKMYFFSFAFAFSSSKDI